MIYPGHPSEWDAHDWCAMDTEEAESAPVYWPFTIDWEAVRRQQEWDALPEEERKRAKQIQAAMRRAHYNNPMAY